METKDIILLLAGAILTIPLVYLKEKVLDKWFDSLSKVRSKRKLEKSEKFNIQIEKLISSFEYISYVKFMSETALIRTYLYMIIAFILMSLDLLLLFNRNNEFILNNKEFINYNMFMAGILGIFFTIASITTLKYHLKLSAIIRRAMKDYLEKNNLQILDKF